MSSETLPPTRPHLVQESIPPKPSEMGGTPGDEAFKYMSLWVPFVFKLPQFFSQNC